MNKTSVSERYGGKSRKIGGQSKKERAKSEFGFLKHKREPKSPAKGSVKKLKKNKKF